MKNIREIHRYKLIEDHKHDRINLQGIILNKSEWAKFSDKKKNLERYIKTFNNPNGEILYEVINAAKNNEIIFKSWYEDNEMPDIYTKLELSIMERPELCEIAKYYGIATVNKPKSILVQFIMKSQDKKVNLKQDIIEPIKTVTIAEIDTPENLKNINMNEVVKSIDQKEISAVFEGEYDSEEYSKQVRENINEEIKKRTFSISSIINKGKK